MALELKPEDRVDEKESEIIPSYKGRFPIALLRRAWNNPMFKADVISFYNLPSNASFGQFIRTKRGIILEPKAEQPKLSEVILK